jgi:predicted transcriptional regulator YdeE
MRIFLITLVVSTIAGIVLWQFGFAHRIWPAHPFLATVVMAAGCGIVVQLALSQDARSLPTRIAPEPGFMVVGISARTTNAREMSGRGIIGEQWARFVKDGLLGKIPKRVDSNIVAIYTDYENDHSGAYTYILGAKVSAAETVPSGMVVKKVPPGKYAVFTTERGPVEKVVPAAWQRINSLPKSAPAGNRTYQADYELYGPGAADPRDAQVEIYVGIR